MKKTFEEIHKVALQGFWVQALRGTIHLLEKIREKGDKDLERIALDYRTTLFEWLRVTPQPFKPFPPTENELKAIYEEWKQATPNQPPEPTQKAERFS